MNRRNLLPTHRQSALHRRRAIRRWTSINGLYLGLLIIAGTVYAYGTASPAVLGEPKTNLITLNNTLLSFRQQTAMLTTNLRATQEITQRPDWSVLLALLAGSLGDTVVLEAIDASVPADAASSLPLPPRLRLTAVADSQVAVTQFVLRLEQLRLFSRVQLEKTAAGTTNGTGSVKFQVTCAISEEAKR